MEDSDQTPAIDIDIDYDIEVKKELLDEEVQHSLFMKKLLGEHEDVKPSSSFQPEIDENFRSSRRGSGRKNKDYLNNCPSKNNQLKVEIKLEPGEIPEVVIPDDVDSFLDGLEAVNSLEKENGRISIMRNESVSQNNQSMIEEIEMEPGEIPEVVLPDDVDSFFDGLEAVNSLGKENGRISTIRNKSVPQNNQSTIEEIEMESDQTSEVVSDYDPCFDEFESFDSPGEKIRRIIIKRSSRVSNSNLVLRKQKKSHSKQQSVDCTVCEFSCTSASRLLRHMRTHTKERNYLCTMCDFKCNQSADLRYHLRCHTGEKPFHCPFCDYSSARNQRLQTHLKHHTAEKPHRCSICNYSCIEAADLKAHMFKHTGIKPFSCTICKFRAAKSSDLVKHVMIHTGEKPYKCHLCNYRCRRAYHLKCHMNKRHETSKVNRKK